ncbi:MAG: T9SS type A sorting domain-containing protein [Crocinitomicaceae bacterium]|nr:T9SS type A sorting domain-containing protein [Crocinitomicaceae bacterium]
MKKIYSFIAVLTFGSVSFGQGVDTLTTHFVGTPTIYGITGQPGYLAGNNGYGDLAKMQLFDDNYGVVGPGSVSKVLLSIPVKTQVGAGAGTFQVKIWADADEAPGSEAGSVTLTMADIDTSLSAFQLADGAVFYNVIASFSSAVTIPAGQKFWAGVVLPTSSGDTLALYTTTDGDFPDAITHAGEFWSDNSFYTLGDPGNWDIDVALSIFPIVNITALSGISEEEFEMSYYPNPTNGVMNFVFNSSETSHILVKDMSGRIVQRVDVNGASSYTADLSELSNGTYVFEVISTEGVVSAKSKFVKQ